MSPKASMNALSAPAGDVLAFLATIVTAKYSLRRYITISSLLPPPPPTIEEMAKLNNEKKDAPKITGWRRYFTKSALKAYRQFTVMVVVQNAIFGLPRLANRMVLDVFYSVGLLVLFFFVAGIATLPLHPDPVQLSLQRKTPTPGLSLNEEDLPHKVRHSDHIRTAFAAIVSLSVFISGYNGFNLPQALMTGLFAVQISSLRFPKMSTMIKLFGACLVAIPTLTAILVPIFTYYFGEEAPNSPKRGVASPSEWLMPIMLFASGGFSIMLPSVILSMTNRFEYRLHGPPLPLRTAKVDMISTTPVFHHPLYNTGLFTLLISLLTAPILGKRCFPTLIPSEGLGMFGMFFTTPTTLLSIVLVAWKRSELRDWWKYEEVWVPNKTEAAEILANHAEMAVRVDEKYSDEDEVDKAM